MSLHAQMTPEAKEKLAAQQRNSTISSIVIALLGCALVGIILMIIAMTVNVKKTPEIISYNSASTEDDKIEDPKMTNQVERKPSSPSSSMSKVIASNSTSALSVPVPDIQVTEASLDFGDGDDFGDGWGDGDGDGTGGGGFGAIPSSMKKRCSKADRLERLRKSGGNEACEDAVMLSLRYLQKTQKPDGSWTTHQECGMTGLALLAYLGHCETPTSPEFGETVEKAITYLVGVGLKNKGKISNDLRDKHWPYEHGICTYALAEAYTFCNQQGVQIPNLKEVVTNAGNLIMKNQHSSGGWVYSFARSGGGPGDTSITAWQLQALKACKHTGIEFDGNIKRTFSKALRYIASAKKPDGTIGYRGTRHSGDGPTLTGAGLLCLQQGGKGANSVASGAARWMKKNVGYDYNSDADLYSHYYNGQALMNRGGSDWSRYNKLFRDSHLTGQNSDGSWKIPGRKNSNTRRFQTNDDNGRHYRTCLATLMLEVYYRFLPGSEV